MAQQVKDLHCHCCGAGSIPGLETCACQVQPKKKKKKKGGIIKILFLATSKLNKLQVTQNIISMLGNILSNFL